MAKIEIKEELEHSIKNLRLIVDSAMTLKARPIISDKMQYKGEMYYQHHYNGVIITYHIKRYYEIMAVPGGFGMLKNIQETIKEFRADFVEYAAVNIQHCIRALKAQDNKIYKYKIRKRMKGKVK